MFNVKTKSMLHIYIVPLVDWYKVNRHWLGRFGGYAITKRYPSIDLCDGRKGGRTDTDY